jgi:hypothetical protein
VLIVTNEQDIAADFVVRELDDRGVRVIRLNTERAQDWRLTVQPGDAWRIRSPTRELVSGECAGVWWRRPEVPAAPPTIAHARDAIADQWRALLRALASVPGPVWVSPPSAIRTAEDKALQLRRAREEGFLVPETVWTNDIEVAHAFASGHRERAVVKSLASAWWESNGRGHFVYATPIPARDLPTGSRLAAAPVCFQHPIEPKRDIRVTVVAGDAFGAVRNPHAADVDNEALDWRRAPQGNWSPYQLPATTADACCHLVASLGLRFGAIDLVLDEAGDHWFLELNPNGEWGWLQRAGLPVAQSITDILTQP